MDGLDSLFKKGINANNEEKDAILCMVITQGSLKMLNLYQKWIAFDANKPLTLEDKSGDPLMWLLSRGENPWSCI